MGDGILIIISINISMQHNDRIKFYRERKLYCTRICKRSPVSGGGILVLPLDHAG